MLLEMYEKNNLTEICLKDICSAADDNYNLRSQSDFRVPDIMQSFRYFMSLKNKIIVLLFIGRLYVKQSQIQLAQVQ